MIVGTCLFSLRISACRSLKEKRFALKSLIDRIAHRFNISVAEVDDQDLWQKATVAVAMVSSNRLIIEKTFSQIMTIIENDGRVQLLDCCKEIG
ncbi:DUF503 domain-containing protein [bacterium]|nr:DUF503 domain-containing protein [bacterium]